MFLNNKFLIWSFITLILIPSGGRGFFDGLPLNRSIEVTLGVLLLPLFLALQKKLVFNRPQKTMLHIALMLKFSLLLLAPHSGICFTPPQNFYESVFSKGCFVTHSDIAKTRSFPFEYLNRKLGQLDESPATTAIHFSFLKPKQAQKLVLDSSYGTFKINKNSTSAPIALESPSEVIFDLDKIESTATVGGELSAIISTNKELTFIPQFFDSQGARIQNPFYFNYFYLNDPIIERNLEYLYGSFSILIDLSITLIVSFWILILTRTYPRFLALCLAVCIIQAVALSLGVAPEMVPLFPLTLTAVLLYVFQKEAPSFSEFFSLVFSLLFFTFFIRFSQNINQFSVLSEGDDWRTYQRFAGIGLENAFKYFGWDCPPTFNQPFVFFVIAMHFLGGQSIFLQQVVDMLSIATTSTALFMLANRWGMSNRRASLVALLWVFAAVVLLEINIGHALTELPALLLISLSCLVFSSLGAEDSVERRNKLLVLLFVIHFIGLGWRPNFLPYFFFSFMGLLRKEEVMSWFSFIKAVYQQKRYLVFLALTSGLAIFTYAFRNFLRCGDFCVIAKHVKNLYILHHLSDRFASIFTMASGITDFQDLTQNPIISLMGLTVFIGFLSGILGLFWRKSLLREFPLPLCIIALTAFVIHFFKFDIRGGYGPRWTTPLLPVWVLSFGFLMDNLVKRRLKPATQLAFLLLIGFMAYPSNRLN